MSRFVRCTTKEQADALYLAGLAWFDYGPSQERPWDFAHVQPDPFEDDQDKPSQLRGLPASDWLYLLED